MTVAVCVVVLWPDPGPARTDYAENDSTAGAQGGSSPTIDPENAAAARTNEEATGTTKTTDTGEPGDRALATSTSDAPGTRPFPASGRRGTAPESSSRDPESRPSPDTPATTRQGQGKAADYLTGSQVAEGSGGAAKETVPADPSQPVPDPPLPAQADPPTRDGREEAGAGPVVVRMLAPAGGASIGEMLAVAIVIESGVEVGHTPFHVGFNPGVLRFDHAREGAFLGSDGHLTVFFASRMSDSPAVAVGLSRLGRVGGVSGSGDLCTLVFEVIGSGDAGLSFSRARVRDSENRIVPAAFEATRLIAH